MLTPREEFVLDRNRDRAYESAFLDIGYGVTISGPHLVGRMTSTIDVQPTDRVLEIGTGSGYQSAVLSHLTDQVYSIEIIDPLGKRSAANYAAGQARAIRSSAISTPRSPTAISAGPMRHPSTRSSSPAASTIFRPRCCSS